MADSFMLTERNQVEKSAHGMTPSTWPCLGHAFLGGGVGLSCGFLPILHGFGGASYTPGRILFIYLGFWEEPSGPFSGVPDRQDKHDRDPLGIGLYVIDL